MPVTQTSLLDAWERGSQLAPAARPVGLLALTLPEAEPAALAALPLGLRDAHLLRLRRTLFGDEMECLTRCPACGAELEFIVAAGELLRQAGEPGVGEHWLAAPGCRVRFRLPNSADLLALAHFAPDEFQARMISRCVVAIEGPEGSEHPADLPRDMVERLAGEMERRDPLAIVWLDLGCAQCGHTWKGLFDIAAFLWTDVDRWARTVLHQVHLLARAYGWTEREVLRMSAARRGHYLGMAGT